MDQQAEQRSAAPMRARRPRSRRFAFGGWHTIGRWRSHGWFLLALGGAFGFISVVIAIAYESYWRLPGGVAPNDYVTLGRRTVDTERFEALSILDYDQIRARVPDAQWAWARHYFEQRRLQDEAGAWHQTAVREVSANYLAVLGVAALRGQTAPSIVGDRAAVVSHRLWRRLGGGDPVGMALRLEEGGLLGVAGDDGGLLPVVGVAAPAFAGLGGTVDLWILRSPTAKQAFGHDGRPNARVFGALGQRVSTAGLRELLTAHRFTTVLRKEEGQRVSSTSYHNVSANDRLEVVSGLETRPDLRRATRQRLAWLAALGVMLLALAFQALVERLVATHSAREEALAARLAAGATPGDLVRHSAAGNLGAMALAGTVAVLAFFYLADVLLGVPPFSFFIGALSATATGAGLLCSAVALALAFVFSTVYVSRLVSRRARAYSARRRQGRLARGQLLFIGGACLLLAASVGWRTLHTARVDLGFANTNALLVSVVPADFQRWNPVTVAAETAALPLVRSAAAVERPPLRGVSAQQRNKVRLRGRAGPDDPVFYRNGVSAGFFSVLGVRFLAGRPFAPAAHAEIVLSRAMALRLADNVEAVLGTTLALVTAEQHVAAFQVGPPVVTVVGVVADVPLGRLGDGAELAFYGPPSRRFATGFYWVLAHAGEAEEVVAAIAGLPSVGNAYSGGTFAEARRRDLARQHGVEAVLAAAGVSAFLLAMAGVGAALARDVAARRRDTDVHYALGALPAHLTRSYGLPVTRDVLIAAAALGALVIIAKTLAPAFASVVELWLLALVVPALLAVCVGTLHLSFHRAVRQPRDLASVG